MNNSVVLLLMMMICCQYDIAVEGMISDGFAACKKFFYKEKEPLNYPASPQEDICQKRDDPNKIYFASKFDKELKIPRYSAYSTDAAKGGRFAEPWDAWRVELGLIPDKTSCWSTITKLFFKCNEKKSKNQEREDDKWSGEDKNTQPMDDDYMDNGVYDRGHLNPKNYHSGNDEKLATFTMTNALPQERGHNNMLWNNMEEAAKKLMEKKCIDGGGKPYFITGGIPGPKFMKNKVRIPTHFYTAACCERQKETESFSFGFISQSDTKMGKKDYTVSIMNVKKLGAKVKELWKIGPDPENAIQFFPDDDCFAEGKPSEDAITQLVNKELGRKARQNVVKDII